MKNIKKSIRFIALCITFGLITQMAYAYTPEHIEYAYNSHLTSFPAEIQEVEPVEQQMVNDPWFLIKSIFKGYPTSKPLSERQQRERIFAATTKVQPLSEDIINTDFIDRLELFSGTGEHKKDHLLYRLTHHITDQETTPLLHTITGEKAGRDMLAQPITTIDELQRRASFIQELVENEGLLNHCELQLEQFKENERNLLYFFQKEELLNKTLIEKQLLAFPFKSFNSSTTALQTWTLFKRATLILGISINALFDIATFATSGYFLVQAAGLTKKDHDITYPGLIGAGAFAFGLLNTFVTLAVIGDLKIDREIVSQLQQFLISVNSCVTSMKKLHTLIESNPKLAVYVDSLKALQELKEPSSSHIYEFNKLMELLNTNTFKQNPSFFSSTGRVLRTYKLARVEEVMTELGTALQTFGELDMFVAIAKKIKLGYLRYKGKAPLCTVNFLQNSEKPYIKADRFWNLFVDPSKVVTNDIELGNGKPQNIILTGPNTGGKSTTMKALMINLLLAQTFGIACAEQMTITPFANLDTYINITDYTGGEISGLKAEVLRAKQLVERVKNLPKNQFTFVILDEIFKATSPDQAEKLAHKFLAELCQFDNCMFCDATHFKNLVDLEQQDPKCKNYHMGAIVDENGRVTKYTYKLEPGPSTVHNAAQVAEDSDLW